MCETRTRNKPRQCGDILRFEPEQAGHEQTAAASKRSGSAADGDGDGFRAVPVAFTAFVTLLLLGDFEARAVNDLAQFRLGHFLIVIGDYGFTLRGTDHRILHAAGGLESLGDGSGALVALHALDADRGRLSGGKYGRQAEGEYHRASDRKVTYSSEHDLSLFLMLAVVTAT